MFDSFYTTTKAVCLLLAATASVVAGFRIFARWNRGDDVEAPLYAWLAGGVSAALLTQMVDSFILGGAYEGSSFEWEAGKLSNGVYTLCVALGCLVAVIGLFQIYNKSLNGDDDLIPFLWKWGASLIFLFLFGEIISALL